MNSTVNVTLFCVVAVAVMSLGEAAPAENAFVKKAHERLMQQKKELKSLGCQPVLKKVSVVEQLEFHDDLADKTFFPRTVALRRCMENCGFCGNHHLGREEGRCVPDPKGVNLRQLVMFYYDDTSGKKVYREVEIEEHTACMCA